jgi:hypothetical protein
LVLKVKFFEDQSFEGGPRKEVEKARSEIIRDGCDKSELLQVGETFHVEENRSSVQGIAVVMPLQLDTPNMVPKEKRDIGRKQLRR